MFTVRVKENKKKKLCFYSWTKAPEQAYSLAHWSWRHGPVASIAILHHISWDLWFFSLIFGGTSDRANDWFITLYLLLSFKCINICIHIPFAYNYYSFLKQDVYRTHNTEPKYTFTNVRSQCDDVTFGMISILSEIPKLFSLQYCL